MPLKHTAEDQLSLPGLYWMILLVFETCSVRWLLPIVVERVAINPQANVTITANYYDQCWYSDTKKTLLRHHDTMNNIDWNHSLYTVLWSPPMLSDGRQRQPFRDEASPKYKSPPYSLFGMAPVSYPLNLTLWFRLHHNSKVQSGLHSIPASVSLQASSSNAGKGTKDWTTATGLRSRSWHWSGSCQRLGQQWPSSNVCALILNPHHRRIGQRFDWSSYLCSRTALTDI